MASYNATLTAKTGNAELDRATAGLEIHVHGKAARWVYGGSAEVGAKAHGRAAPGGQLRAAVPHFQAREGSQNPHPVAQRARETRVGHPSDERGRRGIRLCGLIFSWWNNSGLFWIARMGEQTVRDLLIRKMLKIRIKKGGVRYLKLNRAQQEYSRRMHASGTLC